MKKILVTTDLSTHSKSALRFAIQLASQGNVALTFLHVQHILRMTTWTDATYRAYEKKNWPMLISHLSSSWILSTKG